MFNSSNTGINFGGGSGGFTFGSSTSQPSGTTSPFGSTTQPQNAGGLGTTPATTATSTPSSTSFSVCSGGGLKFGQTASTATTAPALGGSTFPTPTPSGFSFGTPASTATTNTSNASSSTGTTSTGFNFSTNASKSAAPASTTSGSSAFAFSTKSTAATSAASTPTPLSFSTTATASTAPNLTTKPTESTTALTTTAAPAPVLGTQPVPNTLKNKTMEEILNKWTSDLDKCAREFRAQALQVAEWDKVLIENGSKISQLCQRVSQTESLQASIDEQFSYVESQQQELSSMLDVYESQIAEIIEKRGGGVNKLGETPTTADSEREKAYTLAENLNKQLDDMSRNLVTMVDDVNRLGKRDQNDEDTNVLYQIAAILNAHLTTLTWIDGQTVSLQDKVTEMSKLQEAVRREIRIIGRR